MRLDAVRWRSGCVDMDGGTQKTPSELDRTSSSRFGYQPLSLVSSCAFASWCTQQLFVLFTAMTRLQDEDYVDIDVTNDSAQEQPDEPLDVFHDKCVEQGQRFPTCLSTEHNPAF